MDENVKRAMSGGKRYCVLCKRYENETLKDGVRVTLHRIPGGKSKSEIERRKLWLRGLKLHRPNLPVTENSRVCMLHFEKQQYVPRESIPKYYNLEKTLDSPKARRVLGVNDSANVDDELYYATKILDAPDFFVDDVGNCEHVVEIEDFEVKYSIQERETDSDHRYSLPPKPSRSSEQYTQTETGQGSLKPEDIENNDEKTRFYTGYSNYLTFMLFFQTFLKHGADKLNYWEGQKRSLFEKTHKIQRNKPGRKRKLRTIDEFFMVCVRLRLGLLQEHLADIFGVSVMTVSRIMNTWINFMFDHMKGLIPCK